MPTNVHPDLVWDSVSTKDISLILSLLRSGWFPYRNPDGDFAWCRNDKRTVVMLTETALSRAQKIRRKIPRAFEITENQSTEEVLAALSDSNVKPNTWVSDSVLCIYHTLNTHGYLRCIEARRGGLLAGASLFIDLGSVVVAETMLTLEPDSAKASFC